MQAKAQEAANESPFSKRPWYFRCLLNQNEAGLEVIGELSMTTCREMKGLSWQVLLRSRLAVSGE